MNESVNAVATREFYYLDELKDYFSYVCGKGKKKGLTIKPSHRTMKKMFANGLKVNTLGNKLIVFKDDLKAYLEKNRVSE